MTVRAGISIDEYLRTHYEHDREYVHGEVVERGMPTFAHGRVQLRLGAIFLRHESKNLYASSEVRNRLEPSLVRVPDVAVYSPAPSEPVPTQPPLVAIEILSPDERHQTLLTKCREYHRWGVRHVWVVDPETRAFQFFDGTDLRTVPQLELPEAGIIITPAEVFD